jgi:hypothetical protein
LRSEIYRSLTECYYHSKLIAKILYSHRITIILLVVGKLIYSNAGWVQQKHQMKIELKIRAASRAGNNTCLTITGTESSPVTNLFLVL